MNRVNALNGDIAGRPSGLFKALSEADAFCAEVDRVHELEIRVQELTEELAEAKALVAQWRTTGLAACPHGCDA